MIKTLQNSIPLHFLRRSRSWKRANKI